MSEFNFVVELCFVSMSIMSSQCLQSSGSFLFAFHESIVYCVYI
jgi:hypothetical protein